MGARTIADPSEDDRAQRLLRQNAYRDALAAIIDSLADDLGQFCMALLGQQAAARKVLTETLTVCFRNARALVGRPLRPYLFGKALTLCRDYESVRSLALGEDADAISSPGGQVLLRRQSERSTPEEMRAALATLRRDEREIVLLRYLGRLDYPAIASLMEVSAEQAKRKAGRALLSLRQLEQPEGPAP